MTNQITAALPNFSQLQPTPNIQNAPSGGANSPNVSSQGSVGGWPPAGQPQQPYTQVPQPNFNQPAAQPQQPVYQQPAAYPPAGQMNPNQPMQPQAPPADPYIAKLVSQGLIGPDDFKSHDEFTDRLLGLIDELAPKVTEYEKWQQSQQQAPAAQPAPAAQQTPPVQDLTHVVGFFQQQGMLANENGQWVAKNPVAAAAADQMNKAAAEVQLRQMELANPQAFIMKYGSEAINQAVGPLQRQMEEMAKQNQMIQQRLENSVPRPDRDWVNSNQDKLYSKDPATGQETLTTLGQLYTTAWETAQRQGITDYGRTHEYAMNIIGPLVAPPQPQQQPKASWMSQVGNQTPDPSFNSPGTIFTNNVPPGQSGYPVGNDGFPRYNILQAYAPQG